ncbi:MAG: hypothetical protein P8Y60_15425 [Calditrichota bacterium]
MTIGQSWRTIPQLRESVAIFFPLSPLPLEIAATSMFHAKGTPSEQKQLKIEY